MVDVNQPWEKLDPRAQRDNKVAASDAYDAVRKFPDSREAAADYVHKCWMRRNKSDKSQPRALFTPYDKLSELEKDKDRAHVDNMKKAVRAVGSRRVAPKGAGVITARDWKRLEAAARALSAKLGRPVSAQALLKAGVEAALAGAKHIAG